VHREGATLESELHPHLTDDEFGRANPLAPPELSVFAFLIGHWRCEARVRLPGGKWQTWPATWDGRYILEGYAIADEYRMTDSQGNLIVLGINLRAYDSSRKAWNMKWLHALSGKWADLGPEDLGGVIVEGPSIVYKLREPVLEHGVTRATYTVVSPDHFRWRGEKCEDGDRWQEFIVVECYRR
jgi:hypothetical protein